MSPKLATPPPVAPPPPAPVSGQMSDTPIAVNGWGEDPSLPVNYHDDGPIGTAIRYMGPDARMDVDGEPLATVLGKLATDVVLGRSTPQEGVDGVTALRDRLPADSAARAQLDSAIRAMDAPPSPAPRVPDIAPQPLRDLVTELHAIPMVRNDPSKELAPLTELCEQAAAGQVGRTRLIREVENLANRRHEAFGDSGKFTIDRAVHSAVAALRNTPPDSR
jgi:hypothetical protein